MIANIIYLNICASAGRANSTDLASWLGLFSQLEILESWRGTSREVEEMLCLGGKCELGSRHIWIRTLVFSTDKYRAH